MGRKTMRNRDNSYRVVFIHTIKGLTTLFDELLGELIPQATGYHIVDDTLIHTVLSAGKPTPYIYRRLTEHAVAAEEFGADAIQLTCSSVSEVVDTVKHSVSIPLLKIDEPMIRNAVSRFKNIAVIATAPSTLNPTMNQIAKVAKEMGRTVKPEATLCKGAYQALLSGNREEHDRIVKSYLVEAAKKCDAILLAQASITRVVESIKKDPASSEVITALPILSSPRPAVEHLARILKGELK